MRQRSGGQCGGGRCLAQLLGAAPGLDREAAQHEEQAAAIHQEAQRRHDADDRQKHAAGDAAHLRRLASSLGGKHPHPQPRLRRPGQGRLCQQLQTHLFIQRHTTRPASKPTVVTVHVTEGLRNRGGGGGGGGLRQPSLIPEGQACHHVGL